jgi:DNA-directed RNA polymerase specialized sigma24 family protein
MCAASLLWWDRDFDSNGNPIRPDVRNAGQQLWGVVCRQTVAYLGDASDAPGLMESSVAQISRYMDRRNASLAEQEVKSLLMCAFYRSVQRHISKLRRFEPASESLTYKFASFSHDDNRLDAEKLVQQLSGRTRQMFELRNQGYDWQEIANFFKTTTVAVRAEFSREIRRLRRKFAAK